MRKTRVVLADDHKIVRTCLRQALEKNPHIVVVGEASNGVEAINEVNKQAPDVLLLDMEMPVLGGVEVARELHATGSPVRIVALSAYDDPFYKRELLANGAADYLTKDEALEVLVETIQRVVCE